MDFGLSFSYFFQDDEWVKKLIIGSVLVLLTPITFGLALLPLYGWVIGIVRNVNRGLDPVLPEWTDFGKLIVDGLKAVAIGIIWALPIILLNLCLWALIPLAGSQGEGFATAATGLNAFFNFCIALPYYLILSVLAPAMVGLLGDEAEFSTAANPKNAFDLVRANFGGYIIVLLVAWFILPLISTVGLLICFIGIFPAVTYGSAVYGHLAGQAFRDSAAAGGLQPASA